jgi:deoxyribodipyrimidine photolyase
VLSPYVRFGELSVRVICARAEQVSGTVPTEAVRADGSKVVVRKELKATFMRRFMWRDLAYWSLWRFPTLPNLSLRVQYEDERWAGSAAQLRAWQRGRTGVPLVDAAMRQLWRVGWMPNYLRHVCAQYLIEYCDLSWKHGFEWFDYTLIDSDVAINAYMWQNGGHSGLDQWNFVMHPVHAAKSCDPEGAYVQAWVPELRGVPKEFVHCPWEAPMRVKTLPGLQAYPARSVKDFDEARERHTRHVLEVRESTRATAPHLLDEKSGMEVLDLGKGAGSVRLITRVDFRNDIADPKTVYYQTADEARDPRKRPLHGHQNAVMQACMEDYWRNQDAL